MIEEHRDAQGYDNPRGDLEVTENLGFGEMCPNLNRMMHFEAILAILPRGPEMNLCSIPKTAGCCVP